MTDRKYANYRETSYDERIHELAKVHGAADCAEYADRETFIEQVIPKLDTYSVLELWVLSALLRDGADSWLGKFVAYYARKTEAAVAKAIANGEKASKRWYLPSPTLLWGEWRAQQAHHCGYSEGWEKHAAHAKRVAETKPKIVRPTRSTTSLTLLHDWNPTKPS